MKSLLTALALLILVTVPAYAEEVEVIELSCTGFSPDAPDFQWILKINFENETMREIWNEYIYKDYEIVEIESPARGQGGNYIIGLSLAPVGGGNLLSIDRDNGEVIISEIGTRCLVDDPKECMRTGKILTSKCTRGF